MLGLKLGDFSEISKTKKTAQGDLVDTQTTLPLPPRVYPSQPLNV